MKIAIDQKTYDRIAEIYNESKETYQKMNINSLDAFIGYILENFCNSSQQFKHLNDKMKDWIQNIDLSNLNYDELFKNIIKTSFESSQNKDESKKQEKSQDELLKKIDGKKKDDNLN